MRFNPFFGTLFAYVHKHVQSRFEHIDGETSLGISRRNFLMLSLFPQDSSKTRGQMRDLIVPIISNLRIEDRFRSGDREFQRRVRLTIDIWHDTLLEKQ